MKRVLVLFAVVAVAAGSAGAAGGDGGGIPTMLVGGQGVLSPSGNLRYVTLTTGRQTILSVVRVRGGQVLRWRSVRGYVGVPVIGLDGTTEGVSRDGRTLVLVGSPNVSRDGATSTGFAVVDTRTLRLRRIGLRGSWSYDALSPDASTLFLVEYLAQRPNAPYRVRMYDLEARRLLQEVLVDRRESEAVMRGRPVTRAWSPDGRWAYTLYARARNEPFVHALDTVRREAFCIDLPLELRLRRQLGLRLGVRLGGGELVVRAGHRTAAVVDTSSLRVRSE